MQEIIRCRWAGHDPLYCRYHDREWGVPVTSDRRLFEMLILEGAQAGLSWITILRKRPNYRKAFDNFNPASIARYNRRKVAALMNDAGIVRNRLKIEATIGNAQAYLALRESDGRLADFLWQFVDGTPVQNRWRSMRQVPSSSAQSEAMSRELKRRGFRFVGSTICYAFMQAVGMVNDHTTDCFRHAPLAPGARPGS